MNSFLWTGKSYFRAALLLGALSWARTLSGQDTGVQPNTGNTENDAVSDSATIVSFNVPGATETLPYGINTNGATAGSYYNSAGHYRGFVRNQAGAFVTFAVPKGLDTYPLSINDDGSVTGYYSGRDFPYPNRGFLRQSDGTIITFDVPDATNTLPASLNASGTITGFYSDSNNVYHGFLRTPGGDLTRFNAPGAGSGSSQGTVALSINAAGAVTGSYYDSTQNSHGFVRSPSGNLVIFDVAGCLDTSAASINNAGTVTGICAQGGTNYGYLRVAGVSTKYIVPGSTLGVQPAAINEKGAVTGLYWGKSEVVHGYLRHSSGDIVSFDPAGSTWTQPTALNAAGVVTGYFIDATGYHGFLRKP